jgi:diguanylate cyclase (GGDEF)-like protein/PAS domain S-box-containing protein
MTMTMAVKPEAVSKPEKKKKNKQDDLSHLAKAIISNAGVGIYIVQHSKFVYVSQLYKKLTRYDETDLIGTYPLGNIHPDDREMVREQAIKCLKGERFRPYEYRFVKKNNEVMWVLETITPIVYKGERASLGSFMDITERKHAESQRGAALEALRQSEEKYRTILESIEEGYFEVDLAGNFTFCNDSMSRLHGYSKEELIGMNYRQYTDKETAKKVFQAYNKVYKTGEPIKESGWRVIRKDGTKRYIEGSVSLQKNSSGKPIGFKGFKGIIRDITERKQIEEKLRFEEQRFRALVEHSLDIIVILNLEGIITYINPAIERVLGFKVEERIGASVLEVIHPDDLKSLADKGEILFTDTNAPVVQFEMRLRHQDGSWRTFEAVGSNLVENNVVEAIIINYRDITERKQAEVTIRRGEEKYRTILENIEEGYFEVDLNGNFTFCNNSMSRLIGHSKEELLGINYKQFTNEETAKEVFQAFNKVYNTGESSRGLDWQIIRKNGVEVYIETSVTLKKDSSGKPTGFRGIIRDITERKQTEQQINYMATHDNLTGLPNRLMFSQLLNQAIRSAQRHNRQLAVFFIDLDRFKTINDSLGHEAGDRMLKEMAKRFKKSLRADDVVGRLGGDEFIILTEEVDELNQVANVAHKILSSAIKPMVLLGEECRITASIGISIYPGNGTDEQTLIKNADMAMYFAKEEGRNNYQFYSKDIQSQSKERFCIETNLRRALERNELSLEYQAKMDFKTGMITGVEALLRWQNPSLGSVTPTQFIPVAEETGLIVPIGRWVMKTACAQNVAWQRQGLPPVRMAVNLSLRQLMDDNLLKDIKAALVDSGMAPNLWELEITESMVMQNPTRMLAVLTNIKKMGVRLAIDDFGTGYSSLAQIKHFPIDTLKVDRSFIRNLPQDSEDRAITEAVIAMGKTLSLTVVAEGVETQEQKDFLRDHICDEMQGFHFSRPIAPDKFADLLRKNNTPLTKKLIIP